MLPREILCQTRNQALGLVCVRRQDPNDVLHCHRIMVGVPAIEVGYHGHARVADLSLARELGLRHIGHADHRIAESFIGHAFGVA